MLDELASRLHLIAHQLVEDCVGLVDFLDVDAKQRARIDVQCRFPELLRIHLAQAFVPLDLESLGGGASLG